MPIPISAAGAPPPIEPIALGNASSSGGGDFKQILQSAIQQVEGSRSAADTQIQNFLSGQNGDLHTAILSEEAADLQFEMFLQTRNKVVSAYQEIMQMQL
ncbi:MAG: flagellar hook-basal body complex protein FliE [Bryobacteraceae bacterium]